MWWEIFLNQSNLDDYTNNPGTLLTRNRCCNEDITASSYGIGKHFSHIFHISLTPIQPGCTNTSYIFYRVYEIVTGPWMGRNFQKRKGCCKTLLSEDVSSSAILTLDSGELEIIYLQTTTMKKCMLKFHKAILIDSTNRCSNRKIPLSSIMVMDGNGRSHRFKDVNAKVFLIDKDLNDMAVLRSFWPDTRIRLWFRVQ